MNTSGEPFIDVFREEAYSFHDRGKGGSFRRAEMQLLRRFWHGRPRRIFSEVAVDWKNRSEGGSAYIRNTGMVDAIRLCRLMHCSQAFRMETQIHSKGFDHVPDAQELSHSRFLQLDLIILNMRSSWQIWAGSGIS